MKKNKLFIMGMLAVMLAFGLVLAGCKTDSDDGGGSGDGNRDSKLVAKWYASQFSANEDTINGLLFELKGDGKLFLVTADASTTWTTSGGKITTNYAGGVGTVDYAIEGTILTITGVGAFPLTPGTYCKKAD
jgi:hypothetical protein